MRMDGSRRKAGGEGEGPGHREFLLPQPMEVGLHEKASNTGFFSQMQPQIILLETRPIRDSLG